MNTFDFSSRIKTGAPKAAPRIVLIGVEGVGKTTAGAQCEAPIFLCAESGLVGQGFDNLQNFTPETWEDALDFLRYLASADHPHKSLVVDTIDWLEPKLFSFVCNRDKKGSIEEYGYGKGYIIATDEFRKFLFELDRIHKRGILIMINAHCHIKSFNNPIGDNFDRYELKVCKQIAGLVKEWSDAVLFAKYDVLAVKENSKGKAKGVGGQKRIVQTQYCAAWDAKNRYGLPVTMPFDMPDILASMVKGEPDSAENIIEDINTLIPKLPADKQAASTAYVTANKSNVIKLSQLLNKIRIITEEAA